MTDAYGLFLGRFGSFTEVQKAAFPVVESGKNCIIIAPTGTGKTEAALLPLLNKISSGARSGVLGLYVTPLRALNRDMLKRLTELCGQLGISIAVRHGDTPKKERATQSMHPPQFIITTPESLQNILLTKRLRGALANLRFMVVDEIHELYYNKRGAQLAVAMERIAAISGDFQRVGISATVGDRELVAKFLCGNRKCEVVDANAAKEMQIGIEMPSTPKKDLGAFRETFNLDAAALARLERIADLIKSTRASILFANTRSVVESLGSKLIYLNKISPFGDIGIHHGSLDKEERIKVEDGFKGGAIKAIVATSSLELGIDIGNIDLVIQYASPRQVTRLMQRVGRSGHARGRVSHGKIIVASPMDALESAALCKLAAEGRLETHSIEENAKDVLVNQVCGMVLEYKKIPLKDAYKIVSGAAPYSRLGYADFTKLAEFMAAEHLIRVREGIAAIAGRTREYFFENISVIPDSSRLFVKNAIGGRIISTLDERFVSSNIEEGSVFIIKGLPWKVISIENENIFVEPSFNFEAAIPEWEGEDIPVSYNVAREVFEILDGGIDGAKSYIESETFGKLVEMISMQRGYFIPSNHTVFIEDNGEYMMIYAALGKKANEFLAKVVGGIVAASTPNVSVKSTPYSIIIDYSQASRRPNIDKALEVFKEIDLNGGAIRNFLINSELFRYKFTHVLKLFGIASKKAVLTRNMVSRLLNLYKGSPVVDETFRDLYKNYFDLEIVARFQESLRKNGVALKIVQTSGTPLTNEIIKSAYYYRELMLPLLPSDAEMREFANAIESKSMGFICTYCGYEFSKNIKEVGEGEEIRCPACGSPMVAVYEEAYAAVLRKIKSHKRLSSEEQKTRSEMLMSADLVAAYGKRALLALSTYGIGLSTAARVLKLLRKDYRLFLLDLINAQKSFVRTRKFWKEGG